MRSHLRLLSLIVGVVLLVLPRQAAARAQVSDRQLADRVEAVVRAYAPLTIFDHVTIEIDAGSVTLAGCVTMPHKRTELGDRVARVAGVRTFNNTVRVLPVSQHDADLRVRVARAIYGHQAFWQYATMTRPPIHIIVESGTVTLVGPVASVADRALAYALAQVPGAFAVRNDLRIEKDRAP